MPQLFEDASHNLIQLLRNEGIKDETVLGAMQQVPREQFVCVEQQDFAYDNRPLPIGAGQTISQPYIVALMIEALQLSNKDKVLEVGSGSGYAAAIMSLITAQIFAIERHQTLAHQSLQRLKSLGYNNVEVRCSDGTLGWPEQSPFDAILISANAPKAPQPLIEQLSIGGRLVIPTGQKTYNQRLLCITRTSYEQTETRELCAVSFVPLIGEEGWSD